MIKLTDDEIKYFKLNLKFENDLNDVIDELSLDITYRLHEKGYVGNNDFLHLFVRLKSAREYCNADYITLRNLGNDIDIFLNSLREVIRENPEKIKKFFRPSEVKQSCDEVCACLDKYLINSTDEEVQNEN